MSLSNLPPGVTTSMVDPFDADVCEVCRSVVDNCVCPPCPVCGEYGDRDCYDPSSPKYHGMRLNDEQIDSMLEEQERLYWIDD